MSKSDSDKEYDNNPLISKIEEPKSVNNNPLKTKMLLEDSSHGIIQEFFQREAPKPRGKKENND
jgi:hypothetical protein